MKQVNLSLELAKKMYEGTNEELKKFALENYPELDKKPLPKSWGELENKNGFYGNPAGNVIKSNPKHEANHCHYDYETQEQALASIALAKLSRLREVYRNGWKPDWNNDEYAKYCLYFEESNIKIESYYYASYFLSFQDRKTAELFLENFKNLIEQAKPLMS